MQPWSQTLLRSTLQVSSQLLPNHRIAHIAIARTSIKRAPRIHPKALRSSLLSSANHQRQRGLPRVCQLLPRWSALPCPKRPSLSAARDQSGQHSGLELAAAMASSKNINLVLAGGVNRGISLQGAVQALEDAGVTFKGIAGTSAGAVLGTAIAAGISTSDLKDELFTADFSSFVDGQPSENIWNFGNVLALNEGTRIQEWLTGILQKHLGGASADLTFGNPAFQKFSCFACDISRSELVRFPDDLKRLYGLDPEGFSVVKAARASMAVPFFFDPVKIEKNAGTGSAETSVLVDGGLVSGFPIGAFESQTIPTIGILIYDKPGFNAKIESPVDVGVAMATFLVNFYDDLASRSSTKKDIIIIPPVDGIDPFDFNLTLDDKKKLYNKGYNIAQDFIANHKWLSQ